MENTYWISEDRQNTIDMGDMTKAEALDELLEQCSSEQERSGILAGQIEGAPMKTAYDYGYDYGMETDEVTQVDVDDMIHSTESVPDGDYTAMEDAGVEPDASDYWDGFNAAIEIRNPTIDMRELRDACEANGDPNELVQEWKDDLDAEWDEDGTVSLDTRWLDAEETQEFGRWVKALPGSANA